MNKIKQAIKSEVKELSLEEFDVLCRKCHHMHDEEVWRIFSGFFSRLTKLWGSEQQPCQSSSQ